MVPAEHIAQAEVILRTPGDIALPLTLDAVEGLLDGFAGMVGEAIVRGTLDRVHRIEASGRCAAGFQRSIQPWAFGLLDFVRRARARVARVSDHTPETLELAAGAFIFAEIAATMDPAVQRKFLGELLAENQLDSQHEIFTGWLLQRRGYQLEWTDSSGTGRRPELVARGHGVEFDVECRRFSHDFSEKVATHHTAEFCDLVLGVFRRRSAWGEVEIEIPEGFVTDPSRHKEWRRQIETMLRDGSTSVVIDGGPTVQVRRQEATSPAFTRADLAPLVAGQPHDQVWVVVAAPEGDAWVEPVTFKCRMPRKTPLELHQAIYRTLKPKAREQLREARAGMLAVKIDGAGSLGDDYPTSGFAREMNRRLFRGSRHLVSISYMPRARHAFVNDSFERYQGGWEVVRQGGDFAATAAVLAVS